jgi:hypothetical protein
MSKTKADEIIIQAMSDPYYFGIRTNARQITECQATQKIKKRESNIKTEAHLKILLRMLLDLRIARIRDRRICWCNIEYV